MSYFKGHADDPYSQYRDIHGRIDGIVRNLSAQTHPRRNTLLTVVSHSLGTVILSDYFYDHRNTLKADQRLVFGNFFTLGSPIALYANRLYDPRRTKNPFADFKPQPVADRWGVWVNLFDEDDLIGYPIRPVNPYCRKVVTADLNVKVGTFLSGWNPLSHLGYWEDETVGKIIAEKLAIDWLRANRWDRTETTEQRIGR
ncbi:MAG: hypothetical protein GWM98_27530, partial [Nitrospinaceae bacterium]|nr:hypothetical protein [Nitrospinaceae bacterium]NIR57521.1 hypothetical protein [Nitrospinaceae bacterium]NIS87996.1 hypothetical protein [Nitrospinaceae bacterium]NIT84855.1 hypothetical protein [Nitrospinaceae bacterium]NIU47036.1 hypothetical protein [Nitrospinaceae bacterium]